MATLLIIEDSLIDRRILQEALGSKHRLEFLDSAAGLMEHSTRVKPDLILLDVVLPIGNGLQACQALQGHATTRAIPVFLVSGNASEKDRIAGLAAGADDYIAKPFNPQELALRIENKLSKIQSLASSTNAWLIKGRIKLDTDSQNAWVSGGASERPLALTPIEYRLLLFLMRHERQTFTRKTLLEKVWGAQVHVSERSVDTQIKGLRQKLTPCEVYLETVYGAGYRFDSSSADDELSRSA